MTTSANAAGLSEAITIVRIFKQLDQYMTAQAMEIFLQVALDEGLSIVDIEKRLTVNRATASRSVQYFTDLYKPGQPGLGLMRTVKHPQDRRMKEVYLTSKGKTLAEVIAAAAKGAPVRDLDRELEKIRGRT